jgi:hypothetical protein
LRAILAPQLFAFEKTSMVIGRERERDLPLEQNLTHSATLTFNHNHAPSNRGITYKGHHMYNAKSLLSIANFWGANITPEQEIWLSIEADGLPENERGKFFELYYRYEI